MPKQIPTDGLIDNYIGEWFSLLDNIGSIHLSQNLYLQLFIQPTFGNIDTKYSMRFLQRRQKGYQEYGLHFW